MDYEQRQLIRDTFELVKPMAVPVVMLFYGRLFELDPSLRHLFKTDMRTQSKKLVDTLSLVIDSLDDFEALRPRLRELGRDHHRYGTQPAHYETLTAALLWAFGQALEQDFPPEARRAWRAALEAIASEMIAGAEAPSMIETAR